MKTSRDALMPLFRQKRLAATVFAGVFVGAMVSAFLMPRKYEAEMKILVNRDRVDAVVTPDPDAPVATAPEPVVTEEDLNSEVELIKSRDLLEQVVEACGLESPAAKGWIRAARKVEAGLRLGPEPSETARRAEAVQTLENNLVVEPLKKTDLIRVAYASRDPELSARVLQTLAALYQEKHAIVHRPKGTFGFFDEQAGRYEASLRTAEGRLTAFDGAAGVVDPAAQEQLALQQLSDFQGDWEREQASATAADRRARELQTLASSMTQRQTTQIRSSGNVELLAQLQSTLLSLELKRSDMLTRYADSYPPVSELSDEIAETQKAVAAAQQSPVQETTTDRVPAQDWIATELAKADADRASLESQAAATARVVTHYREVALDLDKATAQRDDLVRDVKTAEDNYLLYEKKRESARISDALDNQRIVNVSIAEAATVPALPSLHLGWVLIGGFFAASVLGVGSAYAVDRLDPGFRSPEELGQFLDLRVLASIPVIGPAEREDHLLG
ncbi:MAG TPA: GumC family protein [Candidatus Aquilonibacter sp.]|nr:GumC family protein [Candidatus Aquilonibacter sp.]